MCILCWTEPKVIIDFVYLVQSSKFFPKPKWKVEWKVEKFKKSKWKVEWKVEKAQKSKWKVEWSGKILCLVMNHNTANKIPYFRMSHHLHLHPHISLFWPKAYSEKTNWINLIRKWKKKWKNTKNQSGKWSGVATFHLKWKVPLKVEKNFEL